MASWDNLSSTSGPIAIAQAYKDFIDAAGGHTSANAEAANAFLSSLGITPTRIMDGYQKFLDFNYTGGIDPLTGARGIPLPTQTPPPADTGGSTTGENPFDYRLPSFYTDPLPNSGGGTVNPVVTTAPPQVDPWAAGWTDNVNWEQPTQEQLIRAAGLMGESGTLPEDIAGGAFSLGVPQQSMLDAFPGYEDIINAAYTNTGNTDLPVIFPSPDDQGPVYGPSPDVSIDDPGEVPLPPNPPVYTPPVFGGGDTPNPSPTFSMPQGAFNWMYGNTRAAAPNVGAMPDYSAMSQDPSAQFNTWLNEGLSPEQATQASMDSGISQQELVQAFPGYSGQINTAYTGEALPSYGAVNMARGGAVRGPGTGRADAIPANLSDGEYVVDAETVSMLGDGSSSAGQQLLDQFRQRLRQQKGGALAQGQPSPRARSPLSYIRGARR